jgi:hypothetical protein
MKSLDNAIGFIVGLLKFLVVTMAIYYGFVGLFMLLKGNPDPESEEYIDAFGSSSIAAARMFFIVILAIPLATIIILLQFDQAAIDFDALAAGVVFYVAGLTFTWLLGAVNYVFNN